ncbi:hypothetical protein ACM66B_001649 [Microbotryomycetes sp. NB124-2]
MLHDSSKLSATSSNAATGRNKHASAEGQPLIITLAIERDSHDQLTKLRSKYFPKHRNYLEAHITLFHALPASHKSIYPSLLQEVAQQKQAFPITIGRPFSLNGKGIGVGVTSPKLDSSETTASQCHNKTHPNKDRITQLRAELVKKLEHDKVKLTPQDAKNQHSPHVTLQNKVDEQTARDSLERLEREDAELFRNGWRTNAVGIELFEYQPDGSWTRLQQFDFAT